MFGFRKNKTKQKAQVSSQKHKTTGKKASTNEIKRTSNNGVSKTKDPNPPPHRAVVTPESHRNWRDDNSVDMSLYTTQSKSTVRYPPRLLNYRTSFDSDKDVISNSPTEFTSEAVLSRYAKLGGSLGGRWTPPAPLQHTRTPEQSHRSPNSNLLLTPSTDPLSSVPSTSDDDYDAHLHIPSSRDDDDETAIDSIMPATAKMALRFAALRPDLQRRTPPAKGLVEEDYTMDSSSNSSSSSSPPSSKMPSAAKISDEDLYRGPVDLDESLPDTESRASSTHSFHGLSSGIVHSKNIYLPQESDANEEDPHEISFSSRGGDDMTHDTYGYTVTSMPPSIPPVTHVSPTKDNRNEPQQSVPSKDANKNPTFTPSSHSRNSQHTPTRQSVQMGNDDDSYGYTINSGEDEQSTPSQNPSMYQQRQQELERQWDENTYGYSVVSSFLSKSPAMLDQLNDTLLRDEDSLQLSMSSGLSKSRSSRQQQSQASVGNAGRSRGALTSSYASPGDCPSDEKNNKSTREEGSTMLSGNPAEIHGTPRRQLTFGTENESASVGNNSTSSAFVALNATKPSGTNATRQQQLGGRPDTATPVTVNAINYDDSGISVLSGLTPALGNDDDTYGYGIADYATMRNTLGRNGDKIDAVSPTKVASPNPPIKQTIPQKSIPRQVAVQQEPILQRGRVPLTESLLQRHVQKLQNLSPQNFSTVEDYNAWKRQQEYQRLYFERLQAKEAQRKAELEASLDQRHFAEYQRVKTAAVPAKPASTSKLVQTKPVDSSSRKSSFGSRSGAESGVKGTGHSVGSASSKSPTKSESSTRRSWSLFPTSKVNNKVWQEVPAKGKNSSSSSDTKRGTVHKQGSKARSEPHVVPLDTFMRSESSRVSETSDPPLDKPITNMSASKSRPGPEITRMPVNARSNGGTRNMTAQEYREILRLKKEAEIARLREEQIESERIQRRKQEAILQQRRINLQQDMASRQEKSSNHNIAKGEGGGGRLAKHLESNRSDGIGSKTTTIGSSISRDESSQPGASGNSLCKLSTDSSTKSTPGKILSPCFICTAAERTHIATPCMHFYFCESCVNEMLKSKCRVCPICSTKNVKFTRVYTG